MPFKDALFDTRHFDIWGGLLLAATLAAGAIAVTWRWEIQRWWHHHPFRLVVQGHLASAMSAVALLLSVATISHVQGWSVYALPILGLIAISFLALVFGWWRWVFLAELRAYEAGHRAIVAKGVKVRLTEYREAEWPWVGGLAGGVAGYIAFLAHPWNHAFHMGMWLLGGLIGFVIGSLIATKTAGLPGIEAHAKAKSSRKQPGRR